MQFAILLHLALSRLHYTKISSPTRLIHLRARARRQDERGGAPWQLTSIRWVTSSRLEDTMLATDDTFIRIWETILTVYIQLRMSEKRPPDSSKQLLVKTSSVLPSIHIIIAHYSWIFRLSHSSPYPCISPASSRDLFGSTDTCTLLPLSLQMSKVTRTSDELPVWPSRTVSPLE